MTRKNVPKLRFKGFVDDWEQRKLGELADIVGGGTPSTTNNEYWNGDIDWYSPNEIGKNIYVFGSEKKITMEGLKKSSAKILPIGTVLFTSRAGIGNTAILAKEGTTNQGFQSIIPKENILDSYFIFSRTIELKRYGEISGAGSTFIEISGKQMTKMPIFVPNIIEQKVIGIFFKHIDSLLALHQCKLDALKSLKQALTMQLFPENNKPLPRLRFIGFDGNWEQSMINNVADRYDNLRVPVTASERIPGNTPYFGANGIQDYVSGYTHDGEFILVAEDGANDLKNYPVHYVNEKVWVNNHAHVLQAKQGLADNKFLMNAIKQINVEPFLVGGGRAKLNADIMMKLKLYLPILKEQRDIGNFFEIINNLIILHQTKLEQLNTLKKAYLKIMFV